MGITSEASRLVAVLSRSQPLKAFNRPESALQICFGVLGLLGTVAVLATLRQRGSQRDLDDTPRNDHKKVGPTKRDHVDSKDEDVSIERITTPPPAYQPAYIDSASVALVEDMAESADYAEQEIAQSPSTGSRFRRRMKKTFKIGRKNAQS